ncbi:hypothetical protein COCON_G00228430 [Conger conger]|uniref:Lumican n=1 Tax=Conger conger TaxID=82655 RepID=A0A9Q1CVC6_CONCO|nr:hypothetical protein COCON_G00228430 [Conger conger]
MSPLFVPLLAVLIGQVSPSHYDYDYYQGPSMMLGPPGPNCPEECECPVLFPSAMYCNKRNLKSVPVVPNGIKYLYLQDNNLKEIKASAFVNATDLRWLILDNNQLTNGAVEKGIFEKLGSLEKLHVNFNNLTEPLGPLAKTMNELKITWNKLSKFPSGTLSGLENLTMVDLHGNELTSDGIAGAFKGLKSLVYLDVSKNKLGKLPMGLPSSIEMLYADYNEIGSLDLSYNKLQTIPEVNENLENLYLQVNKISKFDVGSFCKYMTAINFSKLRHLRLDGNNLTRSSVPDEAANCLRLATDVMVEPTD